MAAKVHFGTSYGPICGEHSQLVTADPRKVTCKRCLHKSIDPRMRAESRRRRQLGDSA